MMTQIAVAALSIAAAANAQVIYEPVNVQYGGQNTYYYAGIDPRIHSAAAFPSAPGAAWGRTGGYSFDSASRSVVERQPRIFTDAFGTFDARVFGMTIDDVVNQANARVPRYFSKVDLLDAAVVGQDGTATVSPYAPSFSVSPLERGGISIRPMRPRLFQRGPVIVVPRGMMDRKVPNIAVPKKA